MLKANKQGLQVPYGYERTHLGNVSQYLKRTEIKEHLATSTRMLKRFKSRNYYCILKPTTKCNKLFYNIIFVFRVLLHMSP